MNAVTTLEDADIERRFAGLDRLYGPGAAVRLSRGHVAVVGLGGVGSWTAEALARCGVGRLTLIDLDHVAESNVNRQVHALTPTLGQAKVEAMAERIALINPECVVTVIDEFVDPENVAQLLAGPLDVICDCTDQVAAKMAMVLHGRAIGVPVLVCGAAGGKTDPLALRSGDLADATYDALLARMRNKLRREHGYAAAARKPSARAPRMGVRVFWLDQATQQPLDGLACEPGTAPQGLSCAGYGSVVMVTAAMGLAVANTAVNLVLTAKSAAA